MAMPTQGLARTNKLLAGNNNALPERRTYITAYYARGISIFAATS